MEKLTKQLISFVITFILAFVGIFAYGQGNSRRQVAVFVHCDKTVTTPTNALRARLTSSLINKGYNSYVVLDRTDEILTALQAEYKYQSGGLVRDDQLVSIGEHLGIDLICYVNITYYAEYKQYFFECKLVNIASRQIESQSFYPSDDTVVSSLSPQEQIRVAGELSKAFYYRDRNRDKKMTVGSIYYDETGSPVYVRDCLMRIGYVDETGEHGFAFIVLPEMSDYPETARRSDLQLRVPYIYQLKLLYTNKEVLGLESTYWALDYEGQAEIFPGEDNSIDHLHKTLDFKDGTERISRSSMKAGSDGSIWETVITIHSYANHHAVKHQCINILKF